MLVVIVWYNHLRMQKNGRDTLKERETERYMNRAIQRDTARCSEGYTKRHSKREMRDRNVSETEREREKERARHSKTP